jgi:hypothetical protein
MFKDFMAVFLMITGVVLFGATLVIGLNIATFILFKVGGVLGGLIAGFWLTAFASAIVVAMYRFLP